jgi:uncharacterized protein (DUF2062 family)
MPAADAFNPVVVAPTYNNARTLGAVIDGVTSLRFPIIVVNDGSTDETMTVLAERGKAVNVTVNVTVITHAKNRGKAAALRTAFAAAREAGYTHALSIDTDGQHDPAEIPKLIEHARRQPQALVLGLRDESAPGYPSKSRLGRRVSNLAIRMESGLRVEDSQCGMRVYPLGLVSAVRCRAGRYGFETEIVTRAAWAGCPIVEVPVACRYLPAGQRVSHLNPFVDTVRGIFMHFRLLGRAMLPWPAHPKWPGESHAPAHPKKSGFRRLRDWLSPTEAWRQVRNDRVSRESFAAALAVGAFIGNLPAYGVQALIGLYAARRLHLHPIGVIVGTHISTPPLGPTLNAAAIALGHLILHGSLPTGRDYNFHHTGFLELVRKVLLEWVIGSPIIGLVCAVLVFVISNRLLRLAAKREPAESPATDRPEDSADRPTEPAPGHAA